MSGPATGDIGLVVTNDVTGTSFDLAMDGPDLLKDDTLATPVIVSLFSDRLAQADDQIPDGTGDRRGWWGDYPLDDPGDVSQPDYIGSRLWLLSRAKASAQTQAAAQGYANECLAWMVEDGAAASVNFSATWKAIGVLALNGVIARLQPNGTVENHEFDYVWTPTLAP